VNAKEQEQLAVLEAALARWLYREGAFERRPPKDWSVWSINLGGSKETPLKPLNSVLTQRQGLAVVLFMKTRQAFAWPDEERAVARELDAWIKCTGSLRDALENHAINLERRILGVQRLRHSRAVPMKMRRQLSKLNTAIRMLVRLPLDLEARLDPSPFGVPPLRRLALSKSRSNLPLRTYDRLLRNAGFRAAERARIMGLAKKSGDEDAEKRAIRNVRRAVSRGKKALAPTRKPHK
jgi:hypothetical protein